MNAASQLESLAKRSGSPRVRFRLEANACATCRRLVTRGGQPRVFRRATLEANGSNADRPQKQWKATLPPLHKNCRCTLETMET